MFLLISLNILLLSFQFQFNCVKASSDEIKSSRIRSPKSLRDLHSMYNYEDRASTGLSSKSSVSASEFESSNFLFLNYEIIPKKLKTFLSINPFPKVFEKFVPFDPTQMETWIKFFLSSRIPIVETFDLIENLLKDRNDKINSKNLFDFESVELNLSLIELRKRNT